MREPLISQQVKAANPFLWVVRTYLDLITRSDRLVYGTGLNRLYSLTHGINTLNDDDLIDATRKALNMKLIPTDMANFMNLSIIKNCAIYAAMLRDLIDNRLDNIAKGVIENPSTELNGNPVEARRYYYLPPMTFVSQLQKAILDQPTFVAYEKRNIITSLGDVGITAELLLTTLQGTEGYTSPNQTSFTAIKKCVNDLCYIIDRDHNFYNGDIDYKERAKPALAILLVLAKLLLGDLTNTPDTKDLSVVNLQNTINITDGTLASIPFPTSQSLGDNGVFNDDGALGISLRGRFYIAAVSNAAFYSPKFYQAKVG